MLSRIRSLRIYKVVGHSMKPSVNSGSYILTRKLNEYKAGDLIVCLDPSGQYLLKRIAKRNGEDYFVTGDNSSDSWDSRDFGPLNPNRILGKVIWH